jgi:hypothetical protein
MMEMEEKFNLLNIHEWCGLLNGKNSAVRSWGEKTRREQWKTMRQNIVNGINSSGTGLRGIRSGERRKREKLGETLGV